MKRSKLNLLLVGGFLAGLMGCTESEPPAGPPPPPPPGTGIVGTITPAPGSNVELSNSRIAIFASLDDLNDQRPFQVKALPSDAPFTFQFEPINAGEFYVDLWKDTNGDNIIDFTGVDDIYCTHGPVLVLNERMTRVDIQVP